MTFMTQVSLEGIPLEIFFDYAVRPDGRKFIGILGVQHRNEEIFPIIAREALPFIYETLKADLEKNPPSVNDLAANDLKMADLRAKSESFKAFLIDPIDAPEPLREEFIQPNQMH